MSSRKAFSWTIRSRSSSELQRSAPHAEPSPHPAMPREQMSAAVLSHAESAQADKERAHAERQRLHALTLSRLAGLVEAKTINAGFINIGEQNTSGIDLGAYYGFDMAGGQLTLGLS